MPRRKGSNTTPPAGPAKPPPGEQQPLSWTRPPPLFLDLGPDGRVRPEAIERQRHEMAGWGREQEQQKRMLTLLNALIEVDAEAQAARRTAKREMRERKRQAEQIEKLERARLDLEERLGAIGALIDKAIDGVDIQANLITAKALTARQRAAGERSGEVRANKAWHAAAREIICNNPKLGHAALVRKILKDVAPPVEPRTVERFVTDELPRK